MMGRSARAASQAERGGALSHLVGGAAAFAGGALAEPKAPPTGDLLQQSSLMDFALKCQFSSSRIVAKDANTSIHKYWLLR